MYFEGRELKSHGEFVKSRELEEGQVYFRVAFVDADSAIPEMVPLVFVGRNLDAAQQGLYFQDVDSYLAGERWNDDDWTSSTQVDAVSLDSAGLRQVHFHVMPETEYSSVCEYEKALDQLLLCSLRRGQWDAQVRPLKGPPEG